MSLLSGLLDHVPPTIAGTTSQKLVSCPQSRPHLVLTKPVERLLPFVAITHTSAASATPEWRNARDQYLNHIMVCRSCYAPTGRHCTVGSQLRASYDSKTMEAQ
ncbi:hypothetical protein [Pseudomonas psychrophila]|uniref:hypothetical protein n=1 Tax=Pseudomonas psychrophila TaxID=122355 RepID=UPI00037618BB|nr:hypothetical protein [Pseudomonas psychrophila]